MRTEMLLVTRGLMADMITDAYNVGASSLCPSSSELDALIDELTKAVRREAFLSASIDFNPPVH